jgi:hypothetical protein
MYCSRRRKPVPWACGKNFLFFTPRPMHTRSGSRNTFSAVADYARDHAFWPADRIPESRFEVFTCRNPQIGRLMNSRPRRGVRQSDDRPAGGGGSVRLRNNTLPCVIVRVKFPFPRMIDRGHRQAMPWGLDLRGEADAAALCFWRVHEFADGRQDSCNGIIVIGEFLVESRF